MWWGFRSAREVLPEQCRGRRNESQVGGNRRIGWIHRRGQWRGHRDHETRAGGPGRPRHTRDRNGESPCPPGAVLMRCVWPAPPFGIILGGQRNITKKDALTGAVHAAARRRGPPQRLRPLRPR